MRRVAWIIFHSNEKNNNTPFFNVLWLTHYSAVLIPGQSQEISYNNLVGEHSPVWSSNNPTLQLSSTGFICHVTATAYFGGTATVTCNYKDRIGNTDYSRSKSWSFTCQDNQMTIFPLSLVLNIGESYQITPNFSFPTYKNPSFYYSGFDNNLVTVKENGVITAKNIGSTTIYITSNLGSNTIPLAVDINNNLGIDYGQTLNYTYTAPEMIAEVSGVKNKELNKVKIPETTWLFEDDYVNGEYKVLGIRYDAFKECKELETIEIPNSIKEIGIAAFWDCSS